MCGFENSLAARYISAKYDNPSRAELLQLQQDIAAELKSIKAEKEDVYTRYPGVHGRFQQSQLDVLDIREQKTCAMFDNLGDMIFARRNQN